MFDRVIYLYRFKTMRRSRPHSPQTVAVLIALSQDASHWRYGYALCQELDLKAGTLYPILMRLADRGLLETSWEQGAPHGRPPRHLYRLTTEGCRVSEELNQSEAGRQSKRLGLRPQFGGA